MEKLEAAQRAGKPYTFGEIQQGPAWMERRRAGETDEAEDIHKEPRKDRSEGFQGQRQRKRQLW